MSLSGERYDVVINANKPIGNYWIKAKGIGDCEFNEVFQTAVLNYNTVPVDQIPFGGDDFDYDSIEINGTVNCLSISRIKKILNVNFLYLSNSIMLMLQTMTLAVIIIWLMNLKESLSRKMKNTIKE